MATEITMYRSDDHGGGHKAFDTMAEAENYDREERLAKFFRKLINHGDGSGVGRNLAKNNPAEADVIIAALTLMDEG